MGETVCWRQSGLDKDKTAAFQAIESGMRRYPDSALLIANKGALLEVFGDVGTAERLYREAYSKAQDHLRRQPESRVDRGVFNSMARRLHLQEMPAPEPPPLPPAADDLIDARPPWQQEASRLMEANDCEGAIRYLNANRLPADAAWYVMVSQADLLCWQNTRADRFREHAFQILDEGLKVLPTSSRLVMSKAEGYEVVGDLAAANRYFDAARVRAQANLSRNPQPAGSEDEEVLAELRLRHKP